jgi:predicted PurR-regulated permease PerM
MTDSLKQQILRYSRILIGLLAIIALNVVGEILYAGRSLILPLALAVIIVYILNPVINQFEKRGLPEWASVILTLLITTVIFIGIGTLIKTNVTSFIAEFPKYEARIFALIENTLQLIEFPVEIFDNSENGIVWYQNPDLMSYLEGFSLTTFISTILGSIQGILSDTFLVLLFLIFLLSGRNQLVDKIQRAFDGKTSERISMIITNINEQIQKYVVVKTLISTMTAGLTMIVLALFGIEFVFVWGLLTFLLNFIPSIGSIIAVVLPLGLGLIQFENMINVVWLLICLGVIQVTIGNVLDPRFVGHRINLSPVVVLFSLLMWGWLWGVVGMFLAVPLMVIIKIILENIPELKFIAILMSNNKKLNGST